MANHVLDCLEAHRTRFPAQTRCPPLFVGVQGPQGSGKTFLTSHLRSLLSEPPYMLSVAVLSIDDLYLPHAGLTALAEAHSPNRLLRGRGLPGTHDRINGPEVGPAEVELPAFDKSLFDGEGDRVAHCEVVRAPVDVVVLEGWRLAEERWNQTDVLAVNDLLEPYVKWWDALDAFIQIKGPSTSPYAIIYQWRLQQEHNMKANNGGRGMTDEQVKTFVDRYIPGYVFFGDGVRKRAQEEEGQGQLPPWHMKGLVVMLDLERNLLGTSHF
ncbi:hypothetical protein BU15DRAFT_86551 [Melanogaster broomeanus]|nr:hypothetical protein BU15DRAFT_86551 [Melanogaster broomeanus]